MVQFKTFLKIVWLSHAIFLHNNLSKSSEFRSNHDRYTAVALFNFSKYVFTHGTYPVFNSCLCTGIIIIIVGRRNEVGAKYALIISNHGVLDSYREFEEFLMVALP